MNMLREEILLLCEDFVKVASNLYESGNITEEEYVRMTKLKLEYIERMKKFA